jgi:acetoin utilization deacetylase AcuC-like enzyme
MFLHSFHVSRFAVPIYRESRRSLRLNSWSLPSWVGRCFAARAEDATPFRIYYADVFEVKLPTGHRFPMGKYEMVRKQLETNIMFGGVSFLVSPIAEIEDILLVHSEDFVYSFLRGTLSAKETRRIGFPWSAALVQRTLASVGGTVASTRDVIEGRFRCAAQLAGGTHHAFPDHGEGFCIFNDIAVAARVALRDYASIRRILVLDLDVHQGNGVAAIFADDSRVFTCSFHGRGNYPFKKQRSDIDIEFEDGTGDEDYLQMLEIWLPRIMAKHSPDLVFFQAGVDALAEDRLGRLALTRAGLRRRNALVFDHILQNSNAGIVVCMGGGYADPISKSVEAHADVYVDASLAVARLLEGKEDFASPSDNVLRT